MSLMSSRPRPAPTELTLPPAARRRRAVVVVFTLLVATLAVSAYVWKVERSDADRRKRDVARQAAVATEVMFVQGTSSLRGARVLVDEFGFVDPGGFDAFARALNGAPGLEGVLLIRRVPDNERGLFEAEIGSSMRDVTREGRLVPAAGRPVHFAVERVAPRRSPLKRLLAVDLLSDPEHAQALETALTTGRATLTGPVELAGSKTTGYMAIAPLYARGEQLVTPEQRRKALAGFVVAGYEAGGFLRAVRAQLPSGADVRITDGDRVVAGTPTPQKDATTVRVIVGGRTWTIATVDPQGVSYGPPLGVLAAGLVLTGLIAILFGQAARRERVLEAAGDRVEQARRRTAALQSTTSALSRAASADEVVGVAFEQALEPLGTAGATVWLVSPDGNTLEHTRSSGIATHENSAPVPVDADLPVSRAVRERTSVVEGATAAVPLLAGDRALGALVLIFPEERPFPDDDAAFALAVGRQVALALERARLSDAEHQLAVSLQRSLLPQALPDLPGVALAAMYLPSLRRVNLGGDWYDALALPEGRLGVAVGDVVGHGPRAAAVMGQLRSALRAIAMEHYEPAQVVDALSRFAETIPEALGTTLVYGVFDPDTASLRYACAGHPPPLLVPTDGHPEFLQGGRSLPLGVGIGGYTDATAEVPAGALLVLYSDGAIEQRGEALDHGLERLVDAATSVRGLSADAATARLLEQLFSGREQEDDVALLTLQLLEETVPRLLVHEAARPERLTAVRRELRTWLRSAGVPERAVADVVLACGEALANAVEHAHSHQNGEGSVTLEARLHPPGEIVARIRDDGQWRNWTTADDRGRGLAVMRSLMGSVDVAVGGDGTVVTLRYRVDESDGDSTAQVPAP
jgi:serine phosphatase RsbU (regulator of sigma subunit)/anti-sigma regulatory factor (Ser/Thr protein kinase)/CHASE1-domain containing sensor protein